jgi:hypothetical protein
MSDATTKRDGGPAFPHANEGSYEAQPDGKQKFVCTDGGNGISIRDWFAGQAMSAIDIDLLVREAGMSANETVTHRARLCYMFADAMLKAREE